MPCFWFHSSNFKDLNRVKDKVKRAFLTWTKNTGTIGSSTQRTEVTTVIAEEMKVLLHKRSSLLHAIHKVQNYNWIYNPEWCVHSWVLGLWTSECSLSYIVKWYMVTVAKPIKIHCSIVSNRSSLPCNDLCICLSVTNIAVQFAGYSKTSNLARQVNSC